MVRRLRASLLLTVLTTAALGYLMASPWLIRLWWWGDFDHRVQLAYGVASLALVPLCAAVAEVASASPASNPLVFGHRALFTSLLLALLAVVAIPLLGYIGVVVALVMVPAAAAALAVAWVRPSVEEDFIPSVYLGVAGTIPVAVAVAGGLQTALPTFFVGLVGAALVFALLLRVRRRARTGRQLGSARPSP